MAPTLAQIRTLTSFQLFGLFGLHPLAIGASTRSLDLMTIDLPGKAISILHQLRYHTNDITDLSRQNPLGSSRKVLEIDLFTLTQRYHSGTQRASENTLRASENAQRNTEILIKFFLCETPCLLCVTLWAEQSLRNTEYALRTVLRTAYSV